MVLLLANDREVSEKQMRELLLPSQSLIHGESHLFISLKIIRDGLQRGAQLFRFAKEHPVPHARLSVSENRFTFDSVRD